MIATYNFCIKGKRHINENKPCQDYCEVKQITPAWMVAAVSDGVSSSAHSEIASKLACETACRYVAEAFPYDSSTNSFIDEDILSVIKSAMHAAQNAVEAYADENDDEYNNYDATLVVTLFNGHTAYVGVVGDSGVALLLDDGELMYSNPMNDSQGHVYPLRFRSKYSVSSVNGVAAVFSATDGVYKDYLNGIGGFDKSKTDVFIPYTLFSNNKEDERETYLETMKTKLVSALEKAEYLTDDMTAVLMLNTDKAVEKKVRAEKTLYEKLLDKARVYEDADVQAKVFRYELLSLYPEFTDEQVEAVYEGKASLEECAQATKQTSAESEDIDSADEAVHDAPVEQEPDEKNEEPEAETPVVAEENDCVTTDDNDGRVTIVASVEIEETVIVETSEHPQQNAFEAQQGTRKSKAMKCKEKFLNDVEKIFKNNKRG